MIYPESFKKEVKVLFPNHTKMNTLLDANDPRAGLLLRVEFLKKQHEMIKTEIEVAKISALFAKFLMISGTKQKKMSEDEALLNYYKGTI